MCPCGHGGSSAVTPGHEAKLNVCSRGLVGARKLAPKPSLEKFPFQKNFDCGIYKTCKLRFNCQSTSLKLLQHTDL